MISLLIALSLSLILALAIDLDHHPLRPAAGPAELTLGPEPPVLVVAKAGQGTYRTVKEALAAAEKYVEGMRVVITVKGGEYKEKVVVTRPNVTLIGDGAGKSVITGSLSTAGGRLTTYQTATFSVEPSATGFVGRGMTFRNTCVGVGTPAVAFQSGADKTVLYGCSVEGFQDTLDVWGGRHFYKNTHIYGAVDFIFGFGAAVFQNCFLHLRNSSIIYITAQGKESSSSKYSGFVFHDCDVRVLSELEPLPRQAVHAYLGRAWRKYASVVYIKTYLDVHIDPIGWAPWSFDGIIPSTVFFGEYLNYGPGADATGKARWPGHRLLGSYSEASQFSVGRFLLADGDWLSDLDVPFNSSI